MALTEIDLVSGMRQRQQAIKVTTFNP